MGPVTRAVQTGIGLVAELKAAKAHHKASEILRREDKDVSHSSANVPVQPQERSPLQIPTPKELPRVEQLQIDEKRDFEVDEDPEYDENFGGAVLPSYNGRSGSPLEADRESLPPYPGLEQAGLEEVELQQPSSTVSPPKLRFPVIIPQRRPGTKIRGFVRAYAPVLANYDIGQEAFLGFLKSFHKASQASPTLAVITVGAGALGSVPEPGSMLVGIGLSLMGLTAMEFQSRRRANTYLDKANDEFFKPRGLYCLVMSFRPDDVPKGEIALQEVDTTKDALKWLDLPSSALKAKTSKFRDSSGLTRGDTALPESAPLIYPDTGYAEIGIREEEDSETKDTPYSKRRVIQTYLDKRAQAKYAYNHPESALAVEKPPQFASKYGDPTHPTVTASTYGHISAAVSNESLEERQAKKRVKALKAKSSGGKITRVLQTSVLYLMIVNLPTEEQMNAARNAVESESLPSSNSESVTLEKSS